MPTKNTVDVAELTAVSRLVREWLCYEAKYDMSVKEYDVSDMTGFCCVSALLLCALLTKRGYSVRIHVMPHHVHCRVWDVEEQCDWIVDPTASQFNDERTRQGSTFVEQASLAERELSPRAYPYYFPRAEFSRTTKVFASLAKALAALVVKAEWSPAQCFTSLSSFNRALASVEAYIAEHLALQRAQLALDADPKTERSFSELLAMHY